MRCANCQRDLEMGVDATKLEPGVIGPRGFVPLGGEKFFCDDECLRRYWSDEPVETLSRRIP